MYKDMKYLLMFCFVRNYIADVAHHVWNGVCWHQRWIG